MRMDLVRKVCFFWSTGSANSTIRMLVHAARFSCGLKGTLPGYIFSFTALFQK